MLKKLLKQEWEAIAGILAAIAAIILHFLHYTDEATLLAILLVLIALLFLRDLRNGNQLDRITERSDENTKLLADIKDHIRPSDVILVGPAELRSYSEQFAMKGSGEVVWFNVCLRMYQAQGPFDVMVKPFIDNPRIKSIRFVLNRPEKERWQKDVLPKVQACSGFAKVEEPYWVDIDSRVSFVIVERSEGRAEALVSFWGEPFMAIGTEKSVPRYVLHVHETSELIPRLKEIERYCRIK